MQNKNFLTKTRWLVTIILLLSFSVTQMWGASTIITKTINTIVSDSSYTVSSGSTINTIATSFKLDANITISTTGTPNCGTFWGSSTKDWRLYQNQSGNVTVSTTSSYELESVTFTYSAGNSGVLNTSGNGSNISSSYQKASGTAISISGTSYTLYVGNTGSATNGQAKITQISVTYKPAASCGSDPTVTGASNNGSFNLNYLFAYLFSLCQRSFYSFF